MSDNPIDPRQELLDFLAGTIENLEGMFQLVSAVPSGKPVSPLSRFECSMTLMCRVIDSLRIATENGAADPEKLSAVADLLDRALRGLEKISADIIEKEALAQLSSPLNADELLQEADKLHREATELLKKRRGAGHE